MQNRIVTIFGASGRTGREVLAEAQARGLTVRAADRKDSQAGYLKGIEQHLCDYNNSADLNTAIIDAEAVIVVFGPMPPYKDVFCARATENIIKAMQTVGVRRLLCQTGAMIGDYPANRSFIFQKFSEQFKKSNPAGYDDRVGQEAAIKSSNLDWTILKPPRLTDGQAAGVVAGEAVNVGMMSSISRKSLAAFFIDEIINPTHLKQLVFIKN